MRFRLLRRRLTISAPRMSISSAAPWPLRWAITAIALGFSAAIGLWAFELGKDLAGLDGGARQEVSKLQAQLSKLRDERDAAQSIANTADTLIATEKAAQEKFLAQSKQLEAENRRLREDLGFYERLLPTGNSEALSIRALQFESLGNNAYKWQVLLMQPAKNAAEFNGKLDITVSGTLSGKAWSIGLPSGAMAVTVKQSRRYEGVIDLPTGVLPKAASARLTEGAVTRASQSIKL